MHKEFKAFLAILFKRQKQSLSIHHLQLVLILHAIQISICPSPKGDMAWS